MITLRTPQPAYLIIYFPKIIRRFQRSPENRLRRAVRVFIHGMEVANGFLAERPRGVRSLCRQMADASAATTSDGLYEDIRALATACRRCGSVSARPRVMRLTNKHLVRDYTFPHCVGRKQRREDESS